MSLEEVDFSVDGYIEHLGATKKTGAEKTYASLLRSFMIWLDKKGLAIESVTVRNIDEYLASLKNSKTMKTVRNAIIGYYQYRYMSLPLGDIRATGEMQRINQLKMLRPRRTVTKLQKFSLSPNELKGFLKKMRDAEVSEELYAGVIVLFYFGARPRELAEYLSTAKISFPKREMLLLTEKTLVERYLAWDPRLDRYMKTWYEFVIKGGRKGLPYPGEWVTKNLKNQMGMTLKTAGVRVTSRTARRTFQTQMRLLKAPEIVIDAALGHVNKNIGDVYTDWTQFAPVVKDTLVNHHYMIENKVI